MNIHAFETACQDKFNLDELSLSDAYYYNSLPLCVIDAVFSIGVRYTSTENAVKRYCAALGIQRVRSSDLEGYDDHTVSDMLFAIEKYGIDESADVLFNNRQRTSTRSGILKSNAVFLFGQALKKDGIQSLRDYQESGISCTGEADIRAIPGQRSGISLQYFYMLAGRDDFCKPDRHILRFISSCVGETITTSQAQHIMAETVADLIHQYPTLTVRSLDYAIWEYMARKGSK